MGAWFGRLVLKAYAHPERSRGGMCVRVKKWREDAQPEWPEAASGTQDIPLTKGSTQAFPESGDVRPAEETGAPGGDLLDPGARPDFPGAPRAADRLRTLPDPPGRKPVVRPEPSGAMPPAGRSESPGHKPFVRPELFGRKPAARPESSGPESGVRGERSGPQPGVRAEPSSGRKPVVRDPWDESGSGAGHTHDPHEVTVQLDAVSVKGDGRIEGGAPGADSGSEGSDGPVFVDESGRRSRRFRRIGMAVGLACAVYAVVIVVTLLSGNSNAPWLPVTGPKDDAPAGKVDTSPVPAESADPSLPVGVLPGTTPTVSGGATPAPGVSGTAPGVTVSPGRPGASADPSAPASQPGGNPSVSTAPSTQPTPSVTPPASPTVTPPASPSPDPSVAPTQTAGGGSAGPGTVADGPAAPSPIASETSPTTAPGTLAPAPSDAPLSSTSPENIL